MTRADLAEAARIRRPPYLCDYWLPNRAKCPKAGVIETTDRDGAPLRFCQAHASRALDQYDMTLDGNR